MNNGDITLGDGANFRCLVKGRKHRAVPLNSATSSIIGGWLKERGGLREEPLFPTRTGRRLSPDAVERLVRKHARTAASRDPSFPADQVHPHVLRHTCAMNLLHNGVDTAVVALWLGHADIRSTTTYLHADMTNQGTGSPADRHRRRARRPLPAQRQAPRLPRRPVTIPTTPASRARPGRTITGLSDRAPPRVGIVAGLG